MSDILCRRFLYYSPAFHVPLESEIIHLATNQTFRVENSVFRIRVECILSAVTDNTGNNSV
jgi:hypothetical protein